MNKKHFLFVLFLGCGALMLYGQNGMTIESDGTVVVDTDLEVAGSSILPKIYEVSANRTLDDSELSLTQTTVNVTVGTNNLTLNLPAISASNRGKIIEFIQVDDNTGDATITPNGSDTINGTPSWVLNGQWQRVRMQSDGAKWIVLDCLGTLLEYINTSNTQVSSPTDGVWFAFTGDELTISPGTWLVEAIGDLCIREDTSTSYVISAVSLNTSTTNNGRMSAHFRDQSPAGTYKRDYNHFYLTDIIQLSSDTTYGLKGYVQTGAAANWAILQGSTNNTIIRARRVN